MLLGTAPLETSHGDRDTVLVGSVTDFWLAQLTTCRLAWP